MQTANILLALGDDAGNTVPKYRVTAAEIAVLRSIHGESAVFDVEPTGTVNIANRAELSRLRQVYGKAVGQDGERIVDALFPGAAARVFETLDEIDLPEEFYKADRRVAPASTPAAEKDVDDMTKAELVAFAKTNDIDIDASDNKAEVLAAIKAATAPEADETGDDGAGDEIGDMPGNPMG